MENLKKQISCLVMPCQFVKPKRSRNSINLRFETEKIALSLQMPNREARKLELCVKTSKEKESHGDK